MLLRNLGLLGSNPWAFFQLLIAVGLGVAVAIAVHEFSHALIADRLGDDTPRRLGRLSLNPLAHLDPMGTILLFIVGFGWGKPVPVNPYFLRGGARTGMAKVALAGPLAGLLTAGLLAIIFRLLGLTAAGGIAVSVFFLIIFFNIVLSIFNLIPLPPLDGFRVALGVLPENLAHSLSRLESYGPAPLLLLIAPDLIFGVGLLSVILMPVINLFVRLYLGGSFL